METIIVGNWKMNKDLKETQSSIEALVKEINPNDPKVIVAVPFTFLDMAVKATKGANIQISAQNCHEAPQGAYTGEISAPMLRSLGVSHCIVGHSERRQYFKETDKQIAGKINALIECGIKPIFCCGERKEDRNKGLCYDAVDRQIMGSLSHLSSDKIQNVIIAYEPIWAIGNGSPATPKQISDMHSYIRIVMHSNWDMIAENVPIIYGGSCDASNASKILNQPDVNGILVGGSSLSTERFVELIRIAGEK